MNNLAIILVDKPTGELDKKIGMEILELFKTMQKNGKEIRSLLPSMTRKLPNSQIESYS
ncbi:MAG: hypothetical protein QXT72_01830 [Candidatus Micrarchaeia archaeon]